MSATETVDAEFRPLATTSAAPAVSWTPSFAVAVDEAISRKHEKRRFFTEVMDADLHYGVIPGTGSKPTLLKPGAEMLLSNMGLNATFVDAEPPTIDVTGADHNGEAYIRYRRICRIYRQLGPTEAERMIVAEAAGSCSSWETKYRYRNDQRKCPECGKPSIIKGKEEYGGGFLCFKKKDGCGAKFKDNDPAIIGQAVGKVANPDVAELENTILKMADKRALVAATLIATGCSDIFTQDVEDAADHEPSGERATEQRATPTPPVVARNEPASAPHVGPPNPDAPGSPVDTKPKRKASDPGTIQPRTLTMLTEAFALMHMTGPEEALLFSEMTGGRVTNADAIRDLAENEARELYKSLSEYRCPACERRPLKGEKHVGACPEDPANAPTPTAEESLPL